MGVGKVPRKSCKGKLRKNKLMHSEYPRQEQDLKNSCIDIPNIFPREKNIHAGDFAEKIPTWKI